MALRGKIWLLATAYGLTIANLYYCQPLLPHMARDLGPAVGFLGALGQVGYLLALLFVVPLGDIVRRRRLVCLLLCAAALALAATAASTSAGMLLATITIIGLTSASVVNVLTAYAATLADERERTQAVATMMNGGMLGILLSRTVAGLVGESAGWRVLFAVAGLVTVLLAAAMSRLLDDAAGELPDGYLAQLRATAVLARREPLLRRHAYTGACSFAAFSAFWATAAFRLAEAPFHFGQAQIGLFGLVGVTGALGIRLVGRAADAGRHTDLTVMALLLGLMSFGALWLGGASLLWMVAGLIAMDLAARAVHLVNLSVAYGLVAGARARVASVYMTIYTIGGVLGAAAGTAAYRLGGWTALCLLGALLMAGGLIPALGRVTRAASTDDTVTTSAHWKHRRGAV